MKVNFIELTNFRGIQKQRITFENKNFVALIGDNGSGKTTILEAITKGFVPVLRTVNAEAMKECDLANKDIRNGANGAAVTLGITLDGEKYIWTNRRRLSSQQPFENAGDVKAEKAKSLKELKDFCLKECFPWDFYAVCCVPLTKKLPTTYPHIPNRSCVVGSHFLLCSFLYSQSLDFF